MSQILSRSIRGRAGFFLSCVFVVSVFVAGFPAYAHTPGGKPPAAATRVIDRCYEFTAFPEVGRDKATALIPEGYRLAEPAGMLFIAARECAALQFGAGGAIESNVIESYIGVPVQPITPAPPHPSGFAGVLPLETYLVQWTTTSERRADWLRETGLGGNQVQVVKNLEFNLSSGVIERQLHVDVPRPARSRYTIDARVTDPGPEQVKGHQNQYWETAKGTLIIFADAPHVGFGPATATITSRDQNSQLGTAFGENQQRDVVEPVGFNTYATGNWTKCLRTATNPCTPDDHER